MKQMRMLMVALVGILVVVLAAGQTPPGHAASSEVSIAAQAATTEALVTVESEQLVTDVVGETDVPLATISPDGTTIAWVQQTGRGRNKVAQLCLFTFVDAEKVCYEAPETYLGFPYVLAWSPDSTQIAFTENPVQLGYESDVWLFDVAAGSFANRTDDGVTGSFRASDVGPFTLDYLPTWNPSSGDLYFWRHTPQGESQFTFELYHLPSAGGEAELVRDLTETFTGQLLAFDNELYFLDGVSAISPDGTKLALVVSSFQDVLNTPLNGLWLLDLTNEAAPPQQLADMTAFQAALPSWQPIPAFPAGLSWTADSAGIVVSVVSNDIQLPLLLFYYVALDTGDITPLVDFSEVEDYETMFTAPEGELPPRYYSPWTATLSPAGNKLLMYNDLGGLTGMMAAPLPPDGRLPEYVYQSSSLSSYAMARSSRSSDGKVLMYGLMFIVTEAATAGAEVEPAEPVATPEAVVESLVSVESERYVPEIVGEKAAPLATVSPDGSAIAWVQQFKQDRDQHRQLCLYAFANADKACFEAPDEYMGFPYALAWSPDSAQIAFTENPIQLGYESDIWLFDVATGTFANRTDDGVTGVYRANDEIGPFTLDYLPMWDTSSGNLYFWRSERVGDQQFTLKLYRLALDGGQEELVRDLSQDFRQELLLFEYQSYYMDGISTISPDGSKLVMAVTSFEDIYNYPQNGLWLVDLTDETAPPRQLADMAALQAALPGWQYIPTTPAGLAWTAESAGVVLLAASNDIQLEVNLVYYVNVERGELTPLMDFSQFQDLELFYTQSVNGLPLYMYAPWTAAVSAAGDKILLYSSASGAGTILAAPLPLDGSPLSLVYEREEPIFSTETRTSVASDGKVVMVEALFNTVEK
jgi:Tol biopolymer transport system component